MNLLNRLAIPAMAIGLTIIGAGPASAQPAHRTLPVKPHRSTQVLFTIKDGKAPKNYVFHLRLPLGTKAVQRGQTIYVLRTGRVLGVITPPWALDARGHRVATTFRLHGDTLVQHVATTQHTAYPVIADPWWNPLSWDWGSCAHSTITNTIGLGVGTASINAVRDMLGAEALTIAGGPYGYAAVAVGSCVSGLL